MPQSEPLGPNHYKLETIVESFEINYNMSTWKTLPMSLVKMDELSPCSTSLFHRMPSSKLEHFKMYTIGANVSLRKKHVSYGTLQRFWKID